MCRGQAGAEATSSGSQGPGWGCTGEEADSTWDHVAAGLGTVHLGASGRKEGGSW